jgi:hypothetical protein
MRSEELPADFAGIIFSTAAIPFPENVSPLENE